MSADVRHRPCSDLGAGLAVLVLFLLPIGACGTTGRKAAPAAPACFACEHPVCRLRKRHTGDPRAVLRRNDTRGGPGSTSKAAEPDRPRKQIFTCVPHADGFVRLAGCPRDGCLCQRPPVRASCRPDMHSSRPPVTPSSAPAALERKNLPTRSVARHRCGPPRPAPCREDDRGTLLIGTGRRQR